MGRIIIPLSGESFRQPTRLQTDTSAPSTQVGPDEAVKAMQIASVLSGPLIEGGSRAIEAIAHRGDDAKYKKDLAAWDARKSARALAAENLLAPPVSRGPDTPVSVDPASISTDEPVVAPKVATGAPDETGMSPQDKQLFLRMDERVRASEDIEEVRRLGAAMAALSAKADKNVPVETLHGSDKPLPNPAEPVQDIEQAADRPAYVAAQARLAAREQPRAPEQSIYAPRAPIETTLPSSPVKAPQDNPEIQAKLAKLKAEQEGDAAPFQPIHFNELKQRMLEATLAGDKEAQLKVAQDFRKSQGYGVHPSGVAELLTGDHIGRAGKELLEIGKTRESALDALLKKQKIEKLTTENKYADAYNASKNKKQAAESVIAAANAGNAEAMAFYNLNKASLDSDIAESTAAVKSAEAQFAERRFAAATTKDEVEAAHAAVVADAKDALNKGKISIQESEQLIKAADAKWEERLNAKRYETMGRPLVSINTRNKFDLGMQKGSSDHYRDQLEKEEGVGRSARVERAHYQAVLDDLKKGKTMDQALALYPDIKVAMGAVKDDQDAIHKATQGVAAADAKIEDSARESWNSRVEWMQASEGIEGARAAQSGLGKLYPKASTPGKIIAGIETVVVRVPVGKSTKMVTLTRKAGTSDDYTVSDAER